MPSAETPASVTVMAAAHTTQDTVITLPSDDVAKTTVSSLEHMIGTAVGQMNDGIDEEVSESKYIITMIG